VTDPRFTFFAYARTGFATGITNADSATGPTRVPLPLPLNVSGAGTVNPPALLLGPGDVEGIDAAQVVRTDPVPGDRGFPPHLFPFVEFDRSDFPWLFSPFGATGDRLRPWLVLAVVRRRPEVTIDEEATPLPVLEIAGVADQELPVLSESWAWAHVQALGDIPASGAGGLGAVEREHPERVVSRLLAARRLHEHTDYVACLVPAFAAGVDAGLGVDPRKALDPAWPAGATTVKLPLYRFWEFSTGQAGDFAGLARRLKPMDAPGAMAGRALDASAPGGGLPSAGPGLMLGGALQPAGGAAPAVPASAFVNSLVARLNAPVLSATTASGPLVVAPPLYGSWAAGRTTVPAAPLGRPPPPLAATRPRWLRELNVHPRHRAAAALGTAIVQKHQEDLMAEAWRQVGELERANALLRQAQLARAAAAVVHAERLSALPAGALLGVAGPALARLPGGGVGAPASLAARVRASRIPPRLLDPAVRRAVRARGPFARRFDTGTGISLTRLVARVNAGQVESVGPRPIPDGAQLLADPGGVAPTAVAAASAQRDFFLTREPEPGHWIRPDRLQVAALDMQTTLAGIVTIVDPPPPGALDALVSPSAGSATTLAAPRTAILKAVDPETTAVARTHARLGGVPATRLPEDPLEPLRFAPVFPTPLFTVLRELGEQHVLPGLDSLPADSVTGVEVDDRFVNAFMVGVNFEMSRELLWRGYPADLRGTSFRQFWDPAGRVPPAGETQAPDLRDIAPIAGWPPNSTLAVRPAAATAARFVVVVRGELLRRFPGTIVHLAQAVAASGTTPREPGTVELYPAFQGKLGVDVSFYAFDLPAADARGTPGWFVVFRQQPVEPRFGLVEASDAEVGKAPATWQLLSWAHLASTAQALATMRYAPALPPASATPANPGTGAAWGTHAADIADIALQDPVRVAIHASDMLPAP
jgi:hypothetical protein